MPKTKRHRGDEITIDGADFFLEQTQDEHNTDEFESGRHLVVRRGAEINFQVQFSRPLSGDKFEVELHRGYRTSFRRGTRFVAELGKPPKLKHQLELKKTATTDGTKVTFALALPANLPVGAYRLELEVSPEHSRTGHTFKLPQELVVLFNPWCPEDGVYMKEDIHRQEYIMNETGLIWAGTHDDMFTWPWNFAQFETTTLEAVLYLLDLYSLDSDARRSPVEVARALTEMVNMNDSDSGILFGLWSDKEADYSDGTDPTAWSGSSAILMEYMETKRPVKYAQCWVFGGTLTTVLRAIGIPARPITNFESAHDSDSNRAIDYFYDKDDNIVEEKSGDSIWNYHVWTEAWMSRPDLGPGYGGWQAVDATPQELSPHSQTSVVGPASVASVKDGQDLKYDNEFVIAEVNADLKYYYETKGGKFEFAGSNMTLVGKNISTKAVGTKRREDITDAYKYKEGTMANRAALGAKENAKPNDVEFEVSFSKRAEIGEDFDIVVTARSSAKERRTVSVRVRVNTITYTGVAGKVIKVFKQKLEVKKGDSNQCSMSLSSKEYLDFLRDQPLLSVTVLSLVEESEQSWVGKFPYRLRTPSLTMTVNGKKVSEDPLELQGGRSYPVKASFTNPLKKTLTNVKFHVEGARLLPATKLEGKSTASGKVASISFEISPKKPRKNPQERTLVVTCQSSELKGVMGTAVLRIM